MLFEVATLQSKLRVCRTQLEDHASYKQLYSSTSSANSFIRTDVPKRISSMSFMNKRNKVGDKKTTNNCDQYKAKACSLNRFCWKNNNLWFHFISLLALRRNLSKFASLSYAHSTGLCYPRMLQQQFSIRWVTVSRAWFTKYLTNCDTIILSLS